MHIIPFPTSSLSAACEPQRDLIKGPRKEVVKYVRVQEQRNVLRLSEVIQEKWGWGFFSSFR